MGAGRVNLRLGGWSKWTGLTGPNGSMPSHRHVEFLGIVVAAAGEVAVASTAI